MKSNLLIFVFIGLIVAGNSFLAFKKPVVQNIVNQNVLANVKIYSNLAEIIQPLSNLPLEFTEEDWRDIRPDSLTLVGTNVNITQQTITKKKKSLNNAQVYVRTPSSSNAGAEFIKATLVDESRNLVKLIDKDVSQYPVYFIAESNHIVYDSDPPQTRYYVDFKYDTTDAVYVSYLRSNLNWKTRYQLNLLDESKSAVLISMADIRNDGQSKVEIEHAELLGDDINLKMHQELLESHRVEMAETDTEETFYRKPIPSIVRAEEVAGLYVFSINKSFSIDAKTNYLLPMFRPRVSVERYNSISKHFHGAGVSTGKGQRSYRISSDRFLSRGNCIVREYNRLVGETPLPDLAAKNKHEFSLGEDADIVYRENATLVSTRTYNESSHLRSLHMKTHTESIYNVSVLLKNFKNRPVKIEFQQQIYGNSVKLFESNKDFKLENLTIKCTVALSANDEKILSYKLEIIT